MANENKPTIIKDQKIEQKKVDSPVVKKEVKPEVKAVDNKNLANTPETAKVEEQKPEVKKEDSEKAKTEVKKVEEKKPKKEEAIANGLNLHISKKHAMYISAFIMGKKIDDAITQLGEVIKLKRVIPFKGEIPHRHALGIMSGRYPVNASKIFIGVLKGLKGNVIVNGLDLEKTRISYASPSWASRPARRGGVKAKRVNLILKAKEIDSHKNSKESKSEVKK